MGWSWVVYDDLVDTEAHGVIQLAHERRLLQTEKRLIG
jgi:hypothetical protein